MPDASKTVKDGTEVYPEKGRERGLQKKVYLYICKHFVGR